MRNVLYLLVLWLVSSTACLGNEASRPDGAMLLNINLSGSLQNPAFSPDGTAILFTRFRRGYNRGPSDLFIYSLTTEHLRKLVSDGSSNVNLPGSSWNGRTGLIVFSSDRGRHDEIYTIAANGTSGDEVQITNHADLQSYEPSFSPDGNWVVFESHKIDVEKGTITKARVDGRGGYVNLTTTQIIKQPNWALKGARILYQKSSGDGWAIWVLSVNGGGAARRITPADVSTTDSVFSPTGAQIIFSGETNDMAHANLFRMPIQGGRLARLTQHNGYDGAPSISPDGRRVAFESARGDPEDGKGTRIWLIEVDR